MADSFDFDAPVWITEGKGPWSMVTLPERLADEIDARYAGPRRGFGAVRVKARIGRTTWVTSMFPSTKAGSLILPIKLAVRRAEDVEEGTIVAVHIDVPDLR